MATSICLLQMANFIYIFVHMLPFYYKNQKENERPGDFPQSAKYDL